MPTRSSAACGRHHQQRRGLRYLRAATFIDATGDAILADLCGGGACGGP